MNFHNFDIRNRNGTDFQNFGMKCFEKLVQGMGMFLKSQWHVPDQNLIKFCFWMLFRNGPLDAIYLECNTLAST